MHAVILARMQEGFADDPMVLELVRAAWQLRRVEPLPAHGGMPADSTGSALPTGVWIGQNRQRRVLVRHASSNVRPGDEPTDRLPSEAPSNLARVAGPPALPGEPSSNARAALKPRG